MSKGGEALVRKLLGTARSGPLRELVIVQLTQGLAGEFAGAILSDHHAVVVIAEDAAQGAPLRRRHDGKSSSLQFQSEARGKFSYAVDLHSHSGRQALRRLLDAADGLIEDLGPGGLEGLGLDPEDLHRSNPRLDILRISPFGLDGPRRGEPGDDRIAQAFGGTAYVTGFPGTPPLHVATPIADLTTGLQGANGLLLALLDRSQQGQVIDLALYETILRLQEEALIEYVHDGTVRERVGNEYGHTVPSSHFLTNDGHWVAVSATSRPTFAALCRAIESPDAASRPEFSDEARSSHREEVNAMIQDWIGAHSLGEVERAFRQEGAPVSLIRSIDDILANEHIRAARMIEEVTGEDGTPFTTTGRAPQLVGVDEPLGSVPAVGQHTEAINRWLAEQTPGATDLQDSPAHSTPLAGLKVLDLGHFIAGPFAGAILAEFGADVVKVDRPQAAAPSAHSTVYTFFRSLNRGKRGLELDLKRTEGRDLLRALISRTDVVIENYRPGTLESWGLSPEELLAINPDLVVLRISGFGQTGPDAARPAFDRVGLAAGGLSYLGGVRDRPPLRPGVLLSDYTAGLFGVFGVLTSLIGVRQGDGGRVVDTSLVGSIVRLLGDVPALRTAAGVARERDEARWSGYEYDVSTADRAGTPFVVSAHDATQAGQALAHLGLPYPEHSLTADQFSDAIKHWSAERDASKAIHEAQQAGLAATRSLSIADLVADAHVRARQNIHMVTDSSFGTVPIVVGTPRFSRSVTAPVTIAAAPGLDAADILELPVDELGRLRREGVVG
ncbi:hypothetical protein GCM10009785_26900 [Brooklawnia cerclae]|uniref:Crotonobetainyl-CoA:carnitine CoA-transferase CaiB-like acyl-CoA transferase n=1 Tax=Brooklawnia cerclae TaxID=349934 RepID=A0ABX0SF64_9ACTN|nr:CoA transferase [Brooklawnia cerclae]NIH57019.1 crotonobetainyl-CoA:carnitine CoA-transferase CaiB-like acyl-CoA transferase [Brooklawnia cerclae]